MGIEPVSCIQLDSSPATGPQAASHQLARNHSVHYGTTDNDEDFSAEKHQEGK
jgi:hypothetical protein